MNKEKNNDSLKLLEAITIFGFLDSIFLEIYIIKNDNHQIKKNIHKSIAGIANIGSWYTFILG